MIKKPKDRLHAAYLIVAIGLPHSGLLHITAVSPLLELHAAKDSVPVVAAAAHAAAPAPASTAASAPVAATAAP